MILAWTISQVSEDTATITKPNLQKKKDFPPFLLEIKPITQPS